MQALLDAGRHNDVKKHTKINELVFNYMSFSHHQTQRLRRMLTKYNYFKKVTAYLDLADTQF